MTLRNITTVVRLLDLRLPSNQFVLAAFVVAVVAGTIGSAIGGDPLRDGLADGTQAGFTVLLSWAIARELDPDHPWSAAVAVFVGAAIFFTGDVRLAVVMTLLFAIRVVVRSAGGSPTVIDLVWLLGLCAFSARSIGGWIGGLALGLALVWDTRLERPSPRIGVVVGALGIVAAGAVTVAGDEGFGTWVVPSAVEAGVLIAAGLGAVALLARREEIASSEDHSGYRMSRERVDRGRALAVGAGVLSFAFLGGPSASAFVGLWAALIGVGLRILVGGTRARTQAAA